MPVKIEINIQDLDLKNLQRLVAQCRSLVHRVITRPCTWNRVSNIDKWFGDA